jgi:hypothetical protein
MFKTYDEKGCTSDRVSNLGSSVTPDESVPNSGVQLTSNRVVASRHARADSLLSLQ